MQSKKIILFDGVCNLCNSWVQFVLKRDRKQQFVFASLQSDTGIRLRKKYGLPDAITSVVLIENGKTYIKSTAVLKIVRELSGLWPLLKVLNLIPARLRDTLYDFVALNRYRWFGTTGSCRLPVPNELHARFI